MDKLLELLKDEELFARPLTLIAGIVAIFVIEASVNPVVKELVTEGPWRRLGLYLLFQLIFIGVWSYKRRALPRVADGKIGLVIAVTTTSSKARRRLRVDLVEKIRETIGESKLTGLVEVVVLSNNQAARVSEALLNLRHSTIGHRSHGLPLEAGSQKAYRRILKRTRARGFIFGRINEGLAGEPNYVLECHALVVTPRVKLEIQKELDRDFGRIWLHKLQIEEKAELIGFPLSADLMFMPVAYIIGIAALMSRDIFTAIRFHETLLSRTNRLVGIPQVSEVQRKLIPILAESHVIAARHYQSIEPDEPKMREHLGRALDLDPDSHMAHVFDSIVGFVVDHDAGRALEAIQRTHRLSSKDGTWRYNEAFLLMYLDRFKEALTIYRAIARVTFENEELTLDEVIDFNRSLLQTEPGKIQSMFILGFLYYKKKGNFPLALEQLERFIKTARNQPKYNVLLKEARKYLKQITTAMNRVNN